MTRWIVDSSVLIDASRDRAEAVRFLGEAAEQGEIWSVTPVRTEVRWGMLATEASIVERLLASIRWLEVSVALADRAGDHGRRWGRSHGLDVIDALVAAAAEELDARVATLNIRDFPMFPDLQPPY